MKKYILYISCAVGALMLNACSKKLDLLPVSSISDANFWKTADQFDAFVTGIHARFRAHANAFNTLGELRSDIYGTEGGSASTFTGEATQGFERLWQHNLDLDNPGVSNFAGFYNNIVQLNLLIDKLNNTNIVTPANKSYYLGLAHGMRAYYYFHLVRTWGDVVLQNDPVTSIDVSNLSKGATPAAEVMASIKEDIEKSLEAYGTNYTFRNQKGYWSKAATLMLKAEVNLWNAHRAGGAADATTALNALNDIQANVPSLTLLPNFSSVFASSNKGNNEIIFAIRYVLNESTMDWVPSSFMPQTSLIVNFHDSAAARQFTVSADNWGGLLRSPVRVSTYRKFNDLDGRKRFTIQAAYNKNAQGQYTIAGAFVKKYEGELNAGARAYTNDYPVYRYADLLLLKAEAKILLGQDPAQEINLVRARGYGSNFNAALHAFPNQPIDSDAKQALLQERLFEFIFEGKRWYDLRRFGDAYVYQNTPVTSTQSYKLLWPIDRNSLTNNRGLVQTPGYPAY